MNGADADDGEANAHVILLLPVETTFSETVVLVIDALLRSHSY